MARMVITNTRTMGQTARSTLGSLLGWGMAATLAYSGWTVWQWVKHERPYHQNEQRVVEAINQRDYERAQALLAEYRTSEMLHPEQRIDLEHRLQGAQQQQARSDKLAHINTLIAAADIPGAQAQLEQLIGSGEYTAEQLEPYRVKVSEYTEAGLFQAIQQRPKDRELLIPRYLQLYPNGENQGLVVQYALTDGVNALADDLTSRADFDTVYGRLTKLNILLDTHTQIAAAGVSVLSPTELRNALGQYEKTYVRLDTSATPQLDALVKVVPQSHSNDSGLGGQFGIERNLNFPPGSLGTVINTGTRSHTTTYLVRFKDISPPPQWSDQVAESWDMETYWKRDKAIGEYFADELRVVTPLTNTQKGQLRVESNRLVARLSQMAPPSPAVTPYGVNPTP